MLGSRVLTPKTNYAINYEMILASPHPRLVRFFFNTAKAMCICKEKSLHLTCLLLAVQQVGVRLEPKPPPCPKNNNADAIVPFKMDAPALCLLTPTTNRGPNPDIDRKSGNSRIGLEAFSVMCLGNR
jgi:hypothetical protein